MVVLNLFIALFLCLFPFLKVLFRFSTFAVPYINQTSAIHLFKVNTSIALLLKHTLFCIPRCCPTYIRTVTSASTTTDDLSTSFTEKKSNIYINMTSTMPMPTDQTQLPRVDSFSTDDITKAFQAAATKPRNHLSIKIVQQDETTVPPPSPLVSRPSSAWGHRDNSHNKSHRK